MSKMRLGMEIILEENGQFKLVEKQPIKLTIVLKPNITDADIMPLVKELMSNEMIETIDIHSPVYFNSFT